MRDDPESPASDVTESPGPDVMGTALPPRLAGLRIAVVGAGTQPSDDPDAPIGNGRAISVLAAREGASVACADRDEGAARETAALVEAEGAKSAVITGDVTDAATCERIVVEAEAALGG